MDAQDEKPKIITDPNKEEREDLEMGARSYALKLVMKGLSIPQGGHWKGSLGVYTGEKAQAILNETIEAVRKTLYPKRILRKIWPELYPKKGRPA